MSKSVAVLYFGGTSLSVTVASRGTGGALIFQSKQTREYSGIINGEFVDTANLGFAISDAVRAAMAGVKAKIDKLYIGVPHSFCDCVIQSAFLNLGAGRKVTSVDTEGLVKSIENCDPTKTVISRKAVFYRLDEGRAVIEASGVVARSVEARVSLLTVANVFIEAIRGCLAGTVFKKVEFLCTALAEPLYFVPEDNRDRTIVMVSCGMFSTAVSVCCGDGLVYLKNFEQGIAHVINDVSLILGVSFDTANMLVGDAVLSVKMIENDNYEILVDGQKRKFGAALVNDIIKSRMEIMAEQIVRLTHAADKNLLKSNAVYICGGNIDAVKGARDFFSKAIGAHITQCVCPLTKQSRSTDLSVDALLNMALYQN